MTSVSACGDLIGPISTFTGECTTANFIANLNAACNVTLLFPDLTPEEAVPEICEYEAPVQFVELQGTYQKDRRYFKGGSALVDGPNFSAEIGGVARFEANTGGNTLIAFPDYADRVLYNIKTGAATEADPHGHPPNLDIVSGCELNTIMCCFADGGEDDGFAGFASNGDVTTDVCHHDLGNSPESNHIKYGWSVLPGDEADTHCVGFTWTEGGEELLGNMMYDISLRNTATKGYKEGVPGAPMCGCVEHMPVVEQAACRTATAGDVTYTFSFDGVEVTADNSVDVTYSDCAEGDLKAKVGSSIDAHVVGAGGCGAENIKYLNDRQFLQKGSSARYQPVDETVWSEQVVGEGMLFLPKGIDDDKAEADFRALVDAGCTDSDGTSRDCIIRRVCPSCNSVPHRDIYYKRLTSLPSPADLEYLDMFMNNWSSKLANGDVFNLLGTDFELYSSYEDALAGTNGWTFCNYDHQNIGFPRDCGPSGHVGCHWNSYTNGGCEANHHGFYVEKPGVAATA